MTGRDGIDVAVRVTPGARRASVGGLWREPDGSARLVIAVRERPEAGAATAAAAAALAEAFGVAGSSVTLKRGGTSRRKTFVVRGEAGLLVARLELLLKRQEDKSG